MSSNTNTYQLCSVYSCSIYRYGYSRFCLKHREHYNRTGDIGQLYLRKFHKTLKPYIKEAKEFIEYNNEIVKYDLHTAKLIMNNPKSYYRGNNLEAFMNHSLDIRSRDELTPKAIDVINTFKYNELEMLARVLAVYMFHLQHPQLLLSGKPLFYHIGKAIWYGCSLQPHYNKRTLSKYFKRPKLTFKQLLLIGAVSSSKLQTSIRLVIKEKKEIKGINNEQK